MLLLQFWKPFIICLLCVLFPNTLVVFTVEHIFAPNCLKGLKISADYEAGPSSCGAHRGARILQHISLCDACMLLVYNPFVKR